MSALNVPAVLVSGVAGAVVTPLWYIAFKDVHAQLVQPGSRQIVDFKTAPASSKVIDLLRGFLVAFVLAYLVDGTEVTTVAGAVGLAALLWLGFPVVLLIAPVIWGRGTMEAGGPTCGGLAGETGGDERRARTLGVDRRSHRNLRTRSDALAPERTNEGCRVGRCWADSVVVAAGG